MPSALEALSQLSQELTARASAYVMLPVGDLVADPDQPRKSPSAPSISPEELTSLKELALSIQHLGVLQPILVRRDEASNHYVIIAGERRWRAAQLAGLPDLPCQVLAGEQAAPAQRALRSITENIQRKGLTLVETVTALGRLVNDLGMEAREVADMLGVSPSWLSQHLAMLKADGPARQALDEGLLNDRETFRLLAKLTDRQQARLLADARKTNQPIARRTAESALQTAQARSAAPAPSGSSRPTVFGRPNETAAPREIRQTTASSSTPMYFLPAVTRPQLEQLFALVGVAVPEDPTEIGSTLLSALGEGRQ